MTCLRIINVSDSRSVENNNKHAENDEEEKGSGQLEDGLAVEAEHVQELGVDKESVAQAVGVDAEPAVVGDEHDGHDAVHDVVLGVVRDNSADGVGQVGAEQSCKQAKVRILVR